MLIKTVLNQLENFKEFVFGKVRLRKRWFEKPTLSGGHPPPEGESSRMSGVRPEKIGLRHQSKRPGGGVSSLVELPSGFPLLPSPGQLSLGRNPGRMGSLGERERTNDPFLQDLSGPMGPTPVLERGCGRLRDHLGMRLPSRQDGRRLWSCAPFSRGRDTDRN